MAVLWDERNLAHLVCGAGAGAISPSEVEEIIRSPRSLRRRLRGGRRAYQGHTASGRLLAVIVDVQGASVLRPRTAWEVRS